MWYCPAHSLPLSHDGAALVCPEGDCFPVVDGIPRFVEPSTYADAFGLQWKRYRLTQLDSYTGTTISRDRARRCLGEVWDTLAGKRVLECGCGAGRFTEVLLGQGAELVSVDLSAAVQTNRELFPEHPVAQADLMRLPLEPQSFDVVFCLGVVQHCPSPEAAIESLYRMVKPGGFLVFDHYTFTLSLMTKSSWFFRAALKRMPPEAGLLWTERLVRYLLPVHKKVRRFRPAQMLLSRVSPVRCYYRAYPELSDELHEEWALLDTHDSLTDYYKHLRTKGSLRRTLEGLGAVVLHCEYGGNGVEARAMRPA